VAVEALRVERAARGRQQRGGEDQVAQHFALESISSGRFGKASSSMMAVEP
jgi:hypothetical protein